MYSLIYWLVNIYMYITKCDLYGHLILGAGQILYASESASLKIAG